jgi:hypothetical protein
MLTHDIQASILAHAAACSWQSRNAADPAHRVLFHILHQCWKSLADNRQGVADPELTQEFQFLSGVHARIGTMTGATVH